MLSCARVSLPTEWEANAGLKAAIAKLLGVTLKLSTFDNHSPSATLIRNQSNTLPQTFAIHSSSILPSYAGDMAFFSDNEEPAGSLNHIYFFIDKSCDVKQHQGNSTQEGEAAPYCDNILSSASGTLAPSSCIKMTPRNLNHIYFFVDGGSSVKQQSVQFRHDIESTTSDGTTPQRSRTSSPASSSTDATTGSVGSTSSSDLNPLAMNFTPRSQATYIHPTPPPSASQLFELRETGDKGFGLFATAPIPLGELIMCEEPLLRITGEAIHSVWGTYCRLNNAQRCAFDSLYGYQAEDLDFESVARTTLVDLNDDSMDEEDIEELVAESVRVMKIFSVNNFNLPPRDLGVFATSSRLNHSCVPNVHHSYNPNLKRTTVFAVRDIEPGEELCITYMGGKGHYWTRPQRIELLRSNYGFTCKCSACSDRTGFSNNRREQMASIAWGLEEFKEGSKPVNPYIPVNRLNALKQAEDLISVMLDEGVVTIELGKAYREASTHALALKDYSKALEYAHDEAMVEKNCLGTALADLKRKGVAAECWREKVFQTIKADLGFQGLQKFGLVKANKATKKHKKAMQANVVEGRLC